MKAYWDYAFPEIKLKASKYGITYSKDQPKDRNSIDSNAFVIGTTLFTRINTKPLGAVVGIWIKAGNKQRSSKILDSLAIHKQEIQNNISMPIIWDYKPNKQAASLEIHLDGIDYHRKENWPTIKQFHLKMVDEICKYIIEPFKTEMHIAANDKIDSFNNYKELALKEVKQIEEDLKNKNIVGKDVEAIVKVRVNQGLFRKGLLNKYGKCCLCGIENPKLLVASHIKPWAKCTSEEKVDLDNGFLLCLNHDGLFDKGLISFDDNGVPLISDKLSKEDRSLLNMDINSTSLTNENKQYLKFHRDNIFIK